MKRTREILVVGLGLLTSAQDGVAQAFTDLNFENATIVQDPDNSGAVLASDAIPGWTAVGYQSPNDILYDTTTLGDPAVSILDNNSSFYHTLDGNYSIYLYGGAGEIASGASISQTGLVPAGTASILFIAQGVASGVIKGG